MEVRRKRQASVSRRPGEQRQIAWTCCPRCGSTTTIATSSDRSRSRRCCRHWRRSWITVNWVRSGSALPRSGCTLRRYIRQLGRSAVRLRMTLSLKKWCIAIIGRDKKQKPAEAGFLFYLRMLSHFFNLARWTFLGDFRLLPQNLQQFTFCKTAKDISY